MTRRSCPERQHLDRGKVLTDAVSWLGRRDRYAETSERLQNFHGIDTEPRLELAVPANPSI